MKRWWLLILSVLTLASLTWGFTYITNSKTGLPIKWPAGSIPIRIMVDNSAALSDGTTRATTIKAAMDTWNALLGSAQFAPTIAAVGSAGDGLSLIHI